MESCSIVKSQSCIPLAKIESSPVWGTSCLTELIYDLISRQFLCGKCPTPVAIQYLHPVGVKANVGEIEERGVHV